MRSNYRKFDRAGKALYSGVKMYINPKFLEPELDLHRLTVDEVLLKVDDFLYDAYAARMFSVRIVHGKGSGVLRNAVRNYLSKHYLVKSSRLAVQGEGGGGVTIVKLTDK